MTLAINYEIVFFIHANNQKSKHESFRKASIVAFYEKLFLK